jgi:hypothetical protein
MGRIVEIRGFKAVLLKSIIDWNSIPVNDGKEYKYPVVSNGTKVLELRPGTTVQLVKPTVRVNMFYLEGLGPVDLVPSKTDPLKARIIKRWKFKF